MNTLIKLEKSTLREKGKEKTYLVEKYKKKNNTVQNIFISNNNLPLTTFVNKAFATKPLVQ